MKIIKLFSKIYGTAVCCHKSLYDYGIFKRTKFDIPVIAIGNLSVGGTGKSPHIEYFHKLLSNHFQLAIVSRGYKRKTKGVQIVTLDSKAENVGDEPLQFKLKFPSTPVFVAEKRADGIQEILKQYPSTNCILLDDALQHWAVQPSLQILLTTFDQPFFDDEVLPFGRLREFKSGYQRADIIIVSKCPAEISLEQKEQFLQKIQPLPHQKVLFSYYQYKEPYNLLNFNEKISFENLKNKEILVLTAIADTSYLEDFIRKNSAKASYLRFPDHHFFSLVDLKQAAEKAKGNIILCTEKDAVKLLAFREDILKQDLKIFVLPIGVEMAFGLTEALMDMLMC